MTIAVAEQLTAQLSNAWIGASNGETLDNIGSGLNMLAGIVGEMEGQGDAVQIVVHQIMEAVRSLRA